MAILGTTRVHRDRVEGQGDVIESETVAGDHQTEAAVTADFEAVAARLGPGGMVTVAGSYGNGTAVGRRRTNA